MRYYYRCDQQAISICLRERGSYRGRGVEESSCLLIASLAVLSGSKSEVRNSGFSYRCRIPVTRATITASQGPC